MPLPVRKFMPRPAWHFEKCSSTLCHFQIAFKLMKHIPASQTLLPPLKLSLDQVQPKAGLASTT